MLKDEAYQREKLEREIAMLQGQLLQLSFEADEVRCSFQSLTIIENMHCRARPQVKLVRDYVVYLLSIFPSLETG